MQSTRYIRKLPGIQGTWAPYYYMERRALLPTTELSPPPPASVASVSVRDATVLSCFVIGCYGITTAVEYYNKALLAMRARALNARMKQPLLDLGVTRDDCEEQIAELLEKERTGTTTGHDRYKMTVYQRWINLLKRDT